MTNARDEGVKRYNLSPHILKDLNQEIDELANIGSEVNFVGFSVYAILLADVCKELAVMLPQNSKELAAFGYIDSACSILVGIGQIMQPKSAPIANRVKGVTNILAGAELYWLLSFGLGPLGFSIDIGVSFLHSLYDLGKTLRRINDFDFWVNDTKNELAYLESERISMIASIAELKEQKKLEIGSRKKKVFTWLIDRREKRLDEICFMINNLNNALNKDINGFLRIDTLKQELLDNSYNTLMLGAAFAGLVLLNFAGVGLPAVVLLTVAVVLFTYKYAPRVGAFFEDVAEYLKVGTHDDDINRSSDDEELNAATHM